MLRNKDRIIILLGTCMVCPSSIDSQGSTFNIGIRGANALNFEQTPIDPGNSLYSEPLPLSNMFNDNKQLEISD